MPCRRHVPEPVRAVAPHYLAGSAFERCTRCGRIRDLVLTRAGHRPEWRDADEQRDLALVPEDQYRD